MEDAAASIENEEAGVAKVEGAAAAALGQVMSPCCELLECFFASAPCVCRKLLYDALCTLHRSENEGERGGCTEEEEQQHLSEWLLLLLDARCSQLIRSAQHSSSCSCNSVAMSAGLPLCSTALSHVASSGLQRGMLFDAFHASCGECTQNRSAAQRVYSRAWQ
jgi:hypothetical protein